MKREDSFNINSISGQNKQGLFHAFNNDKIPDIIIANETNVETKVTDSDLLPEVYHSLRDHKSVSKLLLTTGQYH